MRLNASKERFRAFCFFVPLFIFSYNSSQAQGYYVDPQHKIDSIERLLTQKATTDELISRWNEIARLYKKKKDYPKATSYALKVLQFSKEKKKDWGIGKSYLSLASIQFESGDLTSPRANFTKGIHYAHKSKLISETSWGYSQQGLYFFAIGDTLGAIESHQKSLTFSKKLEPHYRIGDTYDNIALIYSAQGDYTQSLKYFELSYDLFVQLKIQQRIALSAGNVGLVNFWMGNRHTALNFFILSLEHFEATGMEDRAYWVRNEIATVYSSISDYENALIYNHKNLSIAQRNSDTLRIADAKLALSETYRTMGKFAVSLNHLADAHQLYRSKKNAQGLMQVYFERGENYFDQKQYSIALKEFEKARKIAVLEGVVRKEAKCMARIGAIQVYLNNIQEASSWLEKSLVFFKKNHVKSELHFVYRHLVTIDSLQGNYKSAFANYKKYVINEDSDKKVNNETEKLLMRLEFEKKQALATEELKHKKSQRNMAIVALVFLLLLIAVLVYFFNLRTKKLAAEKELLELQKREIDRIKETEQFKARFLTNITHEFRTPLTLIQGHLEILQSQRSDQNESRFREMRQNSNHLLQLINQLLDLSKMDSGEYKLRYVSGNALAEIEQFVWVFSSFADQKNIQLQISKSEAATRYFENSEFVFSEEALAIIVNNLVYNALKYTRESGEVIVAIDFIDDRLVLSVADTGIGIPEKHLPHIFSRFYQVDEPSNKTYEGSGIGLALVKELVHLHDGEIHVQSAEGMGTIFTLTLGNKKDEFVYPTQKEDTLNDSIQSDFSPAVNQSLGDDLPLILLVEDQTSIRKMIIEQLGDAYRYLESANGLEGIQLAQEHLPDLIISDVMMPGVDGLELCTTLKTAIETSHIPIILLTAKAGEEQLINGLEHGADDYLTKPFSLAELKLRVRNVLRTQQMMREKFQNASLPGIASSLNLTSKEDEFMILLTNVIEENYTSSSFDINELSSKLHFSLSKLHRKIKAVAGKSPAEYLRIYRLQRAHEFLSAGYSVSESSWKVGFEDVPNFSKAFKKQFGYPPSEVMRSTS